MVEIIAGEKGKGKTRQLLDRVSADVKKSSGSLIFIDKSKQHMFDLDSKVRLINMEDFDMSTTGEFLGFLAGIISSNRDIEKIYLDSFLTLAFIDTSEGLDDAVDKLTNLSEKFDTDFLLSVSKNESDLPASVKTSVVRKDDLISLREFRLHIIENLSERVGQNLRLIVHRDNKRWFHAVNLSTKGVLSVMLAFCRQIYQSRP